MQKENDSVVESGYGSQIQFRYISASGLVLKSGKTPNASVQVKYKGPNGPGKIAPSQDVRNSNPQWDENSERILLNPSINVIFVVKHTSMTHWASEIARSKEYTVKELVSMQQESGEWAKGFVLPLQHSDLTLDATASLQIGIRAYLTDEERKVWITHIHVDWTVKNKELLKEAVMSLEKELSRLGYAIPSTSSVKALIEIANGLLSVVLPLLDHPQINRDRTVLGLFEAFRAAIRHVEQLAVSGADKVSAETLNSLYGELFVDVISSLRLLEKCAHNPLLVQLMANAIEDCTKFFIQYIPMPTPAAVGFTSAEVSKSRTAMRRDALAVNPVLNDVGAIINMDSPQIYEFHSPKQSSEIIQKISAWVLSSSHSEEKRLLWIHGPSGCGKTQIASSLVNAFTHLGFLGAYFSFHSLPAHGGSVENHPLSSLPGTLALQIAAYRVDMVNQICDAVRRNPGIVPKDSEEVSIQFERLFVEIVRNVANMTEDTSTIKPMLIVLDDLGQCDPQELDVLLSILEESLRKLPSLVRILVMSGDLPSVRQTFEGNGLISIYGYYSPVDENSNSAVVQGREGQRSVKWSEETGKALHSRTGKGKLNSRTALGSLNMQNSSESEITEVPR